MNVCTFLGRLTKDVEIKTVGETEIANFTLAVDRRFKKEGQPTADFLNFVAFGKTAEVISKYCEKGSQIAVVARVQTRTWDDKDGNKRYITEFVVDGFSFAGGKPNNNKETSSDQDFDL